MDDELDELIVAVRADTQAFAADMRTMRGTFDTTLVDSFEQAGRVLERGLLAAIRKGSLGFEDLQRMANAALDQIAAQALQLGLENLFAAPAGSGIGHALGGAVGVVTHDAVSASSAHGSPMPLAHSSPVSVTESV